MSQEDNPRVLGISLVGDQLRIVEAARESENDFQITRVAQGRCRGRFGYETLSDPNSTKRLAEDIMRLYESQAFGVQNVAFALGTEMVSVKKVSLDSGLGEDYVKEHVTWEVEQFAISPTDEYIIDFENISNDEQANDLLVVVVRKKIIKALKQIFKHTDLKLKIVDVDVFSAQRALQVNYDYNEQDVVCLVNVEGDKIQLSLLKGMVFYLAKEILLQGENVNIDDSDAIVSLISKEVKKIVIEHQLGEKVEDLSEIFLFGESIDDPVVEGLQGNYDLQVDRANPFRKIKLLGDAKEYISNIHAECYLVCVGAALRGIQ